MSSEAHSALKVFVEIAETKRIWGAVESAVPAASQGVSLVITSATRDEGKSLTAAGFAVLAAQRTNKRAVAVDLNWYRPSLHEFFNLKPCCGLSKFRSEDAATRLVQPSGFARLDVLTAPTMEGGADTLQASDCERGNEIVLQLKSLYDLVIVDAASVFPTNRNMMDPVTLARSGDGFVIVTMANVTPRQEVKRARTVLETSGAKVLGIVLNQYRNPIC